MATPKAAVTVAEIQQFIMHTLSNEGINVSKTGHNTVELVVTNPSADIGYLWSRLVTQFNARITESSIGTGRGTYTMTLPDSVENGSAQEVSTPGRSLVSLVIAVVVALLAVWMAKMGVMFVSNNWHLINADFVKDTIPPPPAAPP